MKAETIDSMVTDPPAGISFMGKEWDGARGGRDAWVSWMQDVMTECLRVLKPGAHALVWALPRTSHWTALACEKAGFEVRDCIIHIFGSGFPKSRTALKPASEHWWLLRKPLSEKTVAKNVLKHGCGGLNIDASRIHVSRDDPNHRAPSLAWKNADNPVVTHFGSGGRPIANLSAEKGRFPSNFLLSHHAECMHISLLSMPPQDKYECHAECAVAELDRQSGVLKAGGNTQFPGRGAFPIETQERRHYSETGGASRFFYCAKASKRDRGTDNKHPTVKSTKLMSYLITLVTPPGGTVLDPFMGSGSTGVAAIRDGFDFVGIEKEEEYFNIAESRIKAAYMELTC